MTFWSLIRQDGALLSAFAVCAISILIFFGWSAFAPMAEGVVAYGRIDLEDDRIVVQHLEGGLIEKIFVTEGDHVQVGDPLILLTNLSAEAGRNQTALEFASAAASLQRVEALLADASEVVIDLSDFGEISPANQADILKRQRSLFEQQREARTSLIKQFRNRRKGFLTTASSLFSEIEFQEVALAHIEEELAVKRGLFDKRLVPREIVLNLERDETRLLSNIASLKTRISEAKSGADEASFEVTKTVAGLEETLGSERLKLQQEIVQLKEQLFAERDFVHRSAISAPAAGKILNLAFRTNGGVVRPSESILEIVPDQMGSYAVLELRPTDRDSIEEGMQVDIRLSGIDSWRIRPINGQIEKISADIKHSADGRYTYYEARVKLPDTQDVAKGIDIKAGMPVEAFVNSGRSKTLLDYMVEPIVAVMRRGMRE